MPQVRVGSRTRAPLTKHNCLEQSISDVHLASSWHLGAVHGKDRAADLKRDGDPGRRLVIVTVRQVARASRGTSRRQPRETMACACNGTHRSSGSYPIADAAARGALWLRDVIRAASGLYADEC
eukprot:scaffold2874_cov384-Prasinococcus_capsulatus_cf.AAC.2